MNVTECDMCGAKKPKDNEASGWLRIYVTKETEDMRSSQMGLQMLLQQQAVGGAPGTLGKTFSYADTSLLDVCPPCAMGLASNNDGLNGKIGYSRPVQ